MPLLMVYQVPRKPPSLLPLITPINPSRPNPNVTLFENSPTVSGSILHASANTYVTLLFPMVMIFMLIKKKMYTHAHTYIYRTSQGKLCFNIKMFIQ